MAYPWNFAGRKIKWPGVPSQPGSPKTPTVPARQATLAPGVGLTYGPGGKPAGFTYNGQPVPTGSVWGKGGITTQSSVEGYGQLPYGSYDPSIFTNAQLANLGLLNKHEDYDLAYGANGTARQDLATALSGLGTQDDRGLADLLTARKYAGEDYQHNLQDLQRRYDVLGENQAQSANQAGVSEGGALAQALAKRTENQAVDRQPIDTSYQRFIAQNDLAQSRLGEDYGTGVTAANTSFDRGENAAKIDVGRAEDSNAIYQGGGLSQAILQASPTLAQDPRYTIGPDGSVTLAGNIPYTATQPKPAAPKTTAHPFRSGQRAVYPWPHLGLASWGWNYR